MKMLAKKSAGFTLLEVMFAVMIFFMAMFSILSLVSGSLSHIRAFQQTTVDPGTIAAKYSLTNALTEGPDQDDFGAAYPDYRWTSYTTEVSSNGLFDIDIKVFRNGNSKPDSELSVYLFRPQSKKGIGR